MLVGDPWHQSWLGAAWVFVRNGTLWEEQAKLSPTSGTNQAAVSVAIEGDLAVLGGPIAGGASGKAWVYERAGTSWSLVDVLAPTSSFGRLGHSVAIEDGRVVCGAPRDGPDDDGAVYVFERAGTGFALADKLTPAIPHAEGRLGGHVAASGETIVAGAEGFEWPSVVDGMPAQVPGVVFLGDATAGGGFGAPLFDGLLCIGGSIERGPVFLSSDAGQAVLSSPVGTIGSAVIQPGETIYFQGFYRDSGASACGTLANLSNAVAVTYEP